MVIRRFFLYIILFFWSFIAAGNDLRPLFDPSCAILLENDLEYNWPELDSRDFLLESFVRALSHPEKVIEDLKKKNWTVPSELWRENIDFSGGPLRFEVLPCQAKSKSECGILVPTMGIGYRWSRFKNNRQFLDRMLRTHHLVYLEMPGQGETYLLRLADWSRRLSDKDRREFLELANRTLELSKKFAKANVKSSKKDAVELRENSLKLGKILFDGENRDWIRNQYSTLKENYFKSLRQIVERDLGRTVDEIDFLGLSWGGWFLGSALNQSPPYLGRSLTLLDPGFGWLGTLLNPLYKNFDSSLQNMHNAVDFVKSGIDQFIGFFGGPKMSLGQWLNAANLIDDTTLKSESPEVHFLMAKHSRDYLLDPVSRAGAVAMTFILREQNLMGRIGQMPLNYPMTLIQAPDGLFLPPRLQADLAQQFLAPNSQRRVLWISGAPHDLPTGSNSVQKLIANAHLLQPGHYLADDDSNPHLIDQDSSRRLIEKSQLEWEQFMQPPKPTRE